jgi:hypothetical protein
MWWHISGSDVHSSPKQTKELHRHVANEYDEGNCSIAIVGSNTPGAKTRVFVTPG